MSQFSPLGRRRAKGGRSETALKSNTGYLGFIGDFTKACVKGFSTTCPALGAVLYYRFIPYAAECCALSSIKLQAGERERNAGKCGLF